METNQIKSEKRHNRHFLILVLMVIIAALAGEDALADSFGFGLGYFNLTAQETSSTGTKSGNASSLGLYQFLYRHSFLDNFQLGLGYTVMASSGISGDLGYGFDLAAYWFPFTPAEAEVVHAENATAVLTSIWRPFVTLGFYQRQFQAVQTGYAGAGIGGGVERALTGAVSLRVEGRYIRLSGSSTSTANTTDIILGVNFGI